MADPPEHDQSAPVAPFPRFSFDDLQLGVEPARKRRAEPPPVAPQAVAPQASNVMVADEMPAPVADPASAPAVEAVVPALAPVLLSVPPATGPAPELAPAPAAELASTPVVSAAPDELDDVEALAAAVAGPPLVPSETESMSELRALLTSLREPMGPFGQYEVPLLTPVVVPAVAVHEPSPEALTPTAPAPGPAEQAPVAPAPVITVAADAPVVLAAIPIAEPQMSAALPQIVLHDAQPGDSVETHVPTTAVASPQIEGVPVASVASPAAAMPSLSQAPSFVPQRPVAQRPTAPLIVAPPTPMLNRRRKRGFVRKLFSMIVVLGMLGGGAYAAKRYVLDIGKWDEGVKAIAEDVAALRGLDFKKPVVVVGVPPEEYAAMLVEESIELAFAEQPSRAAELRAMGLLQGELSALDIGQTAMIDRGAFYSSKDKKVYLAEIPGLSPAGRRFAISRALTEALLDQHFDWTTEVQSLNASADFGVRAIVDADALSVASSLLTNGEATQIVTDQLNLYQQYGASTNSSYLAAISGRPGTVMAPTFHGIRNDPTAADTLATSRITSDAAVLDLVRGMSSQTIDPGIGAGETMGMTYWYYVLAGRLDDQQSWLAATSWAGDSTTVSVNPGGTCVNSTLSAFNDGGAAALKTALDSWVAAGPIEARATVQLIDGNRVAVMSCDPGPASITMAEGVPLAFGGAPLERALSSTVVPDPTQAVGAPVCLALQARFRNLPFTLPDDQSPLLGLAGGWRSPYVAGNADLAITCLSAPAVALVPEG